MEVRLLAKLSHPNIIRYFTCWIDQTDLTDTNNSLLEDNTKEIVPFGIPKYHLYIQKFV